MKRYCVEEFYFVFVITFITEISGNGDQFIVCLFVCFFDTCIIISFNIIFFFFKLNINKISLAPITDTFKMGVFFLNIEKIPQRFFLSVHDDIYTLLCTHS